MVSLGLNKSPQSIDFVERRVFSAEFLLQRVIIALVKHKWRVARILGQIMGQVLRVFTIDSSDKTATTLSGKWSVKKFLLTSKPWAIKSFAEIHRTSYAYPSTG